MGSGDSVFGKDIVFSRGVFEQYFDLRSRSLPISPRETKM